jgi:hypothetical protein
MNETARKPRLFQAAILLGKLLLFWVAGCAVLWITYGLNVEIEYANLRKPDALVFVMKMSLIMSVLTGGVWLWRVRVTSGTTKAWARFAKILLSTAAVLFLYVLIVLIRRNLWNASQGLSVYSQFLPIVGRVNSEFLSEFKWMIFITQVLPVMSVLSAVLLSVWFRPKATGDSNFVLRPDTPNEQ